MTMEGLEVSGCAVQSSTMQCSPLHWCKWVAQGVLGGGGDWCMYLATSLFYYNGCWFFCDVFWENWKEFMTCNGNWDKRLGLALRLRWH